MPNEPFEDQSSPVSPTAASAKPVEFPSVLERLIETKIKLARFGDPKKSLLWLGIQLVAFYRRGGCEPRKECRNAFGRESWCNVYPRWWWETWGDTQIAKALGRLRRSPQLLHKIREHPDYSDRCAAAMIGIKSVLKRIDGAETTVLSNPVRTTNLHAKL